ncbi:MAG: oligosaccharide flippase family protein [Acidobacteriaceae bacterium]|nr:oligosaccharide flippase family protein [Acidobacteriaceae bacterium]
MSQPQAGSPGQSKRSTTRFVRDVFFANLPLPFQKLRAYLWVIFFAKALGPSGFGIWSLFQTTLLAATVVTSLTQGNAMMRFLPANRTKEGIHQSFSSVLAATSIAAALVALALAVCSNAFSKLLFHDYRGRTVLLIAAACLPLETWFEMMRGLLRALRLNRIWAFFTLARQVPEAGILILLVLWTHDPITLLVGSLFIGAISVLLGILYLIRYQQVRFVSPNRSIWVKYLPYGLALIPGGLVSLLSLSADRYLVAYYLNLKEVGIYSVCFAVSALGFFFVGPLNDVLLPEMSALYDAGDWNQFYSRFSGVQKFVIGVAIGATAMLITFPQQILHLLTTHAFASGGPTLAILGLQGVFMSIVMLYIVLLYVRLRVWWSTVVWAGMGLLVIVFDVILLPRMGIIGAGWSQFLSSVAGAVGVIVLNWDIFRKTFRLIWILQAGTALAGVWLLGHFWRFATISAAGAVFRLMAGCVVFLIGLAITKYLRMSELLTLQRSFSKSRA